DNITTEKSSIFWLLDAFIACAEIFFAFHYLKAKLKDETLVHLILKGSSILIDCVKLVVSLGLAFSSIYK
ncbi:20079_t:CDS:1, partial [Racocetra persica]